MSYLSEVLADNPVHYWRTADPGGQIAHDIGSTPWHLFCGINLLGYSGISNSGGSFLDDQANELQSRNLLQSLTSPFSVECWFYSFGTPAANQFLMAWDNGGVPQSNLLWLSTLQVQFSVNAAVAVDPATRSLQSWHHAVGTYDGSNVRLYVDGSLAATTPLAGPVTINKSIGWGGVPGGATNFFLGNLCELAIYHTAISATRVAAHFSAAEQPGQSPIYQAAGGLFGGGPGNTNYIGLLQQILNSVRQLYG